MCMVKSKPAHYVMNCFLGFQFYGNDLYSYLNQTFFVETEAFGSSVAEVDDAFARFWIVGTGKWAAIVDSNNDGSTIF